MTEADKIRFVLDILKKTEGVDVDFLMSGLAESNNPEYRRNLVRSFRDQIIQVALGTAIPLHS